MPGASGGVGCDTLALAHCKWPGLLLLFACCGSTHNHAATLTALSSPCGVSPVDPVTGTFCVADSGSNIVSWGSTLRGSRLEPSTELTRGRERRTYPLPTHRCAVFIPMGPLSSSPGLSLAWEGPPALGCPGRRHCSTILGASWRGREARAMSSSLIRELLTWVHHGHRAPSPAIAVLVCRLSNTIRILFANGTLSTLAGTLGVSGSSGGLLSQPFMASSGA